ncbi:MAG: hypothetical protein C0449_21315 [Polaromonas sp.]|nr:hypothetical protein [Polaromonas sp.]
MTALYPLEMPMNTEKTGHAEAHPMGEGATDPIELPGSALAALLLLAGRSPLRRRALPAHSRAAHSGPSNCGF